MDWVNLLNLKHICLSQHLFCLQVLRTALSNRLAKVQGFLFRAAFLRRVPLFLRLISENILLCFLVSTMHSTSKYITGTLSLRFRKILTKLIHSHYFEVVIFTIHRCYLFLIIICLLLNNALCSSLPLTFSFFLYIFFQMASHLYTQRIWKPCQFSCLIC